MLIDAGIRSAIKTARARTAAVAGSREKQTRSVQISTGCGNHVGIVRFDPGVGAGDKGLR